MTDRAKGRTKKPAPLPKKKPAPPEPPPVVEPPPPAVAPPDPPVAPPAELDLTPPEDTGEAGITLVTEAVTHGLPNAAISGARKIQKAADKVKEETARTREAAVRNELLNPHLR